MSNIELAKQINRRINTIHRSQFRTLTDFQHERYRIILAELKKQELQGD